MIPRSPITTHVLDTSRGLPVSGLPVVLDQRSDHGWTERARGQTDADGRVSTWESGPFVLSAGTYRLTFDLTARPSSFYPEVTIAFSVTDPGQHYHVPLLLSPFGYSTYRGT